MKGGKQTASIAREIAAIRKLADEVSRRLDVLARRASEIGEAKEYVPVIPPSALSVRTSLADRIVLLLDANPRRKFRPLGIKEAFPSININSIRSALIRLELDGEIKRDGRGWYTSLET